ncbi:serine/threonine-protein kinase [Nocardiopsis mangrovi]|uniref:non-specific serine/threonine protein kinase n=1 Tax=Nocardiopsis mangrovi TaxID=1179818 RepID=A0ABV9DZ02_9ACTN
MEIGDRTASRRYTLVREIGLGGMAEVWQARDEVFGRNVAVKFLVEEEKFLRKSQSGGWSYEDIEQRFMREARIMSRLDHAGIPAVFDWCVEQPDKALGRRYIVMQYIEGKTLAELLDEHHSLAVEETACLAAQICSVLAVAHAERLIHRDLKPGNLMVDHAGLVKVLDFGIAILTDPDATRMTKSSQGSPGTTGYMAPEVRTKASQGEETSDLYALGCVMYEALGGAVFTGTTDQVTAAHLTEIPEPLRVRNPVVPRKLGDLVDQMLLKKPAERPRDVWEVYDRLRDLLPVRGQGFKGREAFDLTRPFVDPWRPVPRVDGRVGASRVPPITIAEPELTNASAVARLREVEALWEAGRRTEALAGAERLVREAREHLGDGNRTALKVSVAYDRMRRSVEDS